jgi:hypothetical protein
MSLQFIFSELRELLTSLPDDVRDSVISFLEEQVSEITDSRNSLGMFQHNSKFDSLTERTTEDLIVKMKKLIMEFNIEMMDLLSKTERDFKKKVGKG